MDKALYLKMIRLLTNLSRQKKKALKRLVILLLVKRQIKNEMIHFVRGIEVEEIHHHPANLACDCCLGEMVEFSSTMVREEAKFIPATMKRVQHFEHTYECRSCKKDVDKKHKSNVEKHHKVPFNEVSLDPRF